jgi:CRISPR-associated endonuclease Csn1
LPTPEELENLEAIDFSNISNEQSTRIYKMISSTGSECHFTQSSISSLILYYNPKIKIGELGSLNKLETTIDTISQQRIKEVCIKLYVDRLSNISYI